MFVSSSVLTKPNGNESTRGQGFFVILERNN
jgi:hypothetical protein